MHCLMHRCLVSAWYLGDFLSPSTSMARYRMLSMLPVYPLWRRPARHFSLDWFGYFLRRYASHSSVHRIHRACLPFFPMSSVYIALNVSSSSSGTSGPSSVPRQIRSSTRTGSSAQVGRSMRPFRSSMSIIGWCSMPVVSQ